MKPAFRSPFSATREHLKVRVWIFAVLLSGGILGALLALSVHNSRKQVQTGKASQTVKVIDGDTIDLDGVRIRLHGIDAPEKGQECSKNAAVFDCGRAAKEYLSFLLTGEDLTCEEKSKDRWNRVVAICRFGGRDISSKMVRAGWAIAYVKYSADYVDDQKFASANTLGMWAKEFETPEEWRKKRRG